MNGERKQKTTEKPFTKLMKLVFTAVLIFLAIIVGIQAGNFMYKLDINLVENVDSENLKETINSALPIIETIYNSGMKSVSVMREIKNMFAKIFEFELDSPITILNAQSPLFMSFYNHEYKDMLAMEGSVNSIGMEAGKDDEDSNTSVDEENKKDGDAKAGEADGEGVGKASESPENTNTGSDDGSGTGEGADQAGEGTGGTGNGTGGTNNGTGEGDTVPNTQNSEGSNQTAIPGEAANDPETTTVPPNSSNDLQPISSITYEAEDDEEDDSDLVALDKMVVRNFTKHKIDIAKLLREPIDFNFSKKGPKVLIYHTHTSESYVLKEEDLGKKGVSSFNTNPKYSVVRVGEELARYLKKYGIDTLHNGTVHDQKHDAAYGASINTLQSYLKSYPSIKVYIDIHRDAVEASKPKLRVVKKINGKNAAQIMFVMGTNDLLPNEHWEENLKFALKVQQKLNEKYPGLARPVWIVGKRYNQHVSNQAVLIEVGGDGNLLSECLESTKYLAEALNDVMMGK